MSQTFTAIIHIEMTQPLINPAKYINQTELMIPRFLPTVLLLHTY